MPLRSAVLASLALVAGVTPSSRRAPVITRYKIESKSETTVDLSAFGQPAQEASLGLTAWVVLTVSDTAGGRIAHVVVDSLSFESSAPQVTQAMADSAKGGTVHGFLDASGHLKNLTPTPSANAMMAEIQGVIQTFFPRVKSGASVGDHWVDTVEVANHTAILNTQSKFVVTYTSAGQATVGGMPATKLTTTSTSTTTGTAENPMAGTVQVEATGTGTGEYFVGADGRYLGGHQTSNADQKITMAMAPTPIPVKAVRTVTVTLIK